MASVATILFRSWSRLTLALNYSQIDPITSFPVKADCHFGTLQRIGPHRELLLVIVILLFVGSNNPHVTRILVHTV